MRIPLRALRPLLASPRVPIATGRRLIDAGLKPRLPSGTRVEPGTLGGVGGEWVTAAGSSRDGVLLYLHGGGYAIGSPQGYRAVVGRLVSGLGVPAFVPDYRLAPEHPHPAAADDAIAVYRALIDQGTDPARIAIAGDSAGGGLALSLAMALRASGDPPPAVVGMYSPWLDLTEDHGAGRADAPGEPLLSARVLTRWARAYLNGSEVSDPAISPLRGELTGLPPLVLHYGGSDPLAPDSDRFVSLAGEAGVELEHHRHDDLWHECHILADVVPEADRVLAEMAQGMARRMAPAAGRPRVGIVGAGMSGLCMAAKLRAAGHDDFAVYEKAEALGGTWRDNHYPGLSCDVPSRYYSYSFAPNPGWSHAFAPGPELQEYFTGVARDLDLERSIRYDSEVTSARWEDGRWRLRTSDGHEDAVDVLVSATGFLHHPRLPEIEGLASFEGDVFHSARWDESVPLDGRRIAVIGTGSTGVQITCALAERASTLSLYQRTAQWVLPVPNRPTTRLSRWLMKRVPAIGRLAYRSNKWMLELIFGEAVIRPGWQRSLISALCRFNLRFGVRDPELRRKLTPDFEPMCKRLVMSADFYPAVQKAGVEVVTEAIERVEPRGIVTADGELHPADVIVLATGFDFHAYMRSMNLVGEGGLTLEQAWADGPRAYRTVAVPGFPNFFTLMGPHSPVGNHSLIAVAETQSDYILDWIDNLGGGEITQVSPKAEVTAAFNAEMRASMPDTIWASGCQSWYLGKDGLPELWPWTPRRHREMLERPELEDFELTRPQ